MSELLMQVEDLKVHFPVRGGVTRKVVGAVKAVDGVSFGIGRGETLGLVGESGCGKSTLGKALVRLLKPTAGRIVFKGTDITRLGAAEMRRHRQDIQMVFQDPAESLNGRLSVGQIIAEPLLVHGVGSKASRKEEALSLLDRVGMPRSAADRFPHEFSGGQRQRIGIARALALRPELIILDEPVSALDVSVQSQVLNLLLELQEEMGLSYLFIAHDLSVVKHISDRVAVMYLGKLVELAGAEDIYRHPRHAYTRALLSAIPVADPGVKKERVRIGGDVPSPINPPEGSAFGHRVKHPRYEESVGMDLSLVEIEPGHWVARDPCCLDEEDWARVAPAKAGAAAL